jgi:hypothetical protein
MQGSGWVSHSEDGNKKAAGWSPFLLVISPWFQQNSQEKINQTEFSRFPAAEHAAGNVRYRAHNPDKQA